MTLSEKRKEIYDYVRSLGVPLEREQQDALSKHLHEYHKLAFTYAPQPPKAKGPAVFKAARATGKDDCTVSVPSTKIKDAYPDTGIRSYKPKAQALCTTPGYHDYGDGVRVYRA